MYRNPRYSEDQNWGNRNQSQRDNRPGIQYGSYSNPNQYQQNYQYQRYEESPGQGGYFSRQRMEVYHSDYDEMPRNQQNDFRGSYRLENERSNAGYQQLDERNYGRDHGYGHAGSSRSGGDYGRNQSDYGTAGTYGASRNAGSMGSYGGAQGFGSSTNGYNAEKWGSGHKGVAHQPYHTVYGAYRDKNSFAPGERESYDGSQRSGSQGADYTRGWTSPGRSGRSGSYQHRTSADDSRYEIYDTSESQYNRGEYNNDSRNSISYDLNLRSHQNYSPREVYGSRQRGYRQGSGNDLDRHSGTSDMEYGQTGTPFEREAYPRNRYYDPQTGNPWNPGSEL